MSVTITDLFCGAGGSSLGAQHAGAVVAMAANHWTKAIDVHQENFPDAAHDCADISQVDPRRYPSTNILLASPECTNHTSAKGISRKKQDPTLFDSPDLGAERSRATMWDVHRFVEHHAYDAVIVENVVEATRWVYWPSWWQAWADAGYDARVVSLNSAHTGEVAQWRDRIYVVATRRGLPAVNVEVRPPSWCPTCSAVVAGRQAFRNQRAAGKWRQQYDYRCPDCHGIVDPPAPSAEDHVIDWTLEGSRIGDRARPLAPATMERIRVGVERYWPAPIVHQAAGNTYQREGSTCRSRPVTDPLGTQTTTAQHALVVPFRNHGRSRPATEPTPTLTAGNGGHGLLMAPQSGGQAAPTTRPAPNVVTKASSLLVTYNRTGQAAPVTDPCSTVTTHDRHALVEPGGITVDDCLFRMLEPHESGRAMAFPDDYRVDGTKKDRQKLYGNAVTPPAMRLLVGRVLDALVTS